MTVLVYSGWSAPWSVWASLLAKEEKEYNEWMIQLSAYEAHIYHSYDNSNAYYDELYRQFREHLWSMAARRFNYFARYGPYKTLQFGDAMDFVFVL